MLTSQESLWPGTFEITLEIKDKQGMACSEKQVLQLDACTCLEGGICGARTLLLQTAASPKLAGLGVAVLLLGFLALMAVPLVLMKAGSGMIPGGFADLPMDAKEYLIPYHTEGKGEDKEVPLLSAPFPISNQEAPIVAQTLSKTSAARTQATLMEGMGFGLDLTEALDFGTASLKRQASTSQQIEVMEAAQREDYESARLHSGFAEENVGPYGPMSLPEEFLEDYYSQKASCITEACHLKDSLLAFKEEGSGSPAGSVGCCSLLDMDNDLEFLNDLDPKFKTLANICRPPQTEIESSFRFSPQPRAECRSEAYASTRGERVVPPKTQSFSCSVPSSPAPHAARTSHYSTLPRKKTYENVMVPSQTYLIQQPMYYAAAPVLQPVQYVMEPRVQYVLSDAPMIGGAAVHGGVIGVQQGTLNRAENVVLVERQVGSGQVLQQGVGGLNQGLVLVEGQVGAGQVLQGGQSWIQQGTLQRAAVPGPQKILLVEREGSAGQVLGSPVSPKRILVTSPAGLPPEPVQMTNPENVLVYERQVRSGQGTMRLAPDATVQPDPVVQSGMSRVQEGTLKSGENDMLSDPHGQQISLSQRHRSSGQEGGVSMTAAERLNSLQNLNLRQDALISDQLLEDDSEKVDEVFMESHVASNQLLEDNELEELAQESSMLHQFTPEELSGSLEEEMMETVFEEDETFQNQDQEEDTTVLSQGKLEEIEVYQSANEEILENEASSVQAQEDIAEITGETEEGMPGSLNEAIAAKVVESPQPAEEEDISGLPEGNLQESLNEEIISSTQDQEDVSEVVEEMIDDDSPESADKTIAEKVVESPQPSEDEDISGLTEGKLEESINEEIMETEMSSTQVQEDVSEVVEQMLEDDSLESADETIAEKGVESPQPSEDEDTSELPEGNLQESLNEEIISSTQDQEDVSEVVEEMTDDDSPESADKKIAEKAVESPQPSEDEDTSGLTEGKLEEYLNEEIMETKMCSTQVQEDDTSEAVEETLEESSGSPDQEIANEPIEENIPEPMESGLEDISVSNSLNEEVVEMEASSIQAQEEDTSVVTERELEELTGLEELENVESLTEESMERDISSDHVQKDDTSAVAEEALEKEPCTSDDEIADEVVQTHTAEEESTPELTPGKTVEREDVVEMETGSTQNQEEDTSQGTEEDTFGSDEEIAEGVVQSQSAEEEDIPGLGDRDISGSLNEEVEVSSVQEVQEEGMSEVVERMVEEDLSGSLGEEIAEEVVVSHCIEEDDPSELTKGNSEEIEVPEPLNEDVVESSSVPVQEVDTSGLDEVMSEAGELSGSLNKDGVEVETAMGEHTLEEGDLTELKNNELIETEVIPDQEEEDEARTESLNSERVDTADTEIIVENTCEGELKEVALEDSELSESQDKEEIPKETRDDPGETQVEASNQLSLIDALIDGEMSGSSNEAVLQTAVTSSHETKEEVFALMQKNVIEELGSGLNEQSQAVAEQILKEDILGSGSQNIDVVKTEAELHHAKPVTGLTVEASAQHGESEESPFSAGNTLEGTPDPGSQNVKHVESDVGSFQVVQEDPPAQTQETPTAGET
ncbi:hypothetical protein COCON_G00069340, partial [Conger conger]